MLTASGAVYFNVVGAHVFVVSVQYFVPAVPARSSVAARLTIAPELHQPDTAPMVQLTVEVVVGGVVSAPVHQGLKGV